MEDARALGNAAYKAQDYNEAKKQYTKGIDTFNDEIANCHTPSHKFLAILYSNRSACFLSLSELQESLADAESAIETYPTYAKAHARKAAALEAIGLPADAASAYFEAARLSKVEDTVSSVHYEAKGQALKSPSFWDLMKRRVFQGVSHIENALHFTQQSLRRLPVEKILLVLIILLCAVNVIIACVSRALLQLFYTASIVTRCYGHREQLTMPVLRKSSLVEALVAFSSHDWVQESFLEAFLALIPVNSTSLSLSLMCIAATIDHIVALHEKGSCEKVLFLEPLRTFLSSTGSVERLQLNRVAIGMAGVMTHMLFSVWCLLLRWVTPSGSSIPKVNLISHVWFIAGHYLAFKFSKQSNDRERITQVVRVLDCFIQKYTMFIPSPVYCVLEKYKSFLY